jgi:hypothetical protein
MKTYDLREIVLSRDETSIGAATYPDRKLPALIVQHGNCAEVYGYFKSFELAKQFMDELAELVGAKKEKTYENA